MKYTFFASVLLLTSFLFAGCDEDYALIKDVSGTWNITQITYKVATGDSVVKGQAMGTFNFDKCRLKKEHDYQCDGYYQFINQNKIAFGYNVIKDDNTLGIYIKKIPARGDYRSPEEYQVAQAAFWGGNQPNLNGSWTIVEQTDNELVIEGDATLGYFGSPATKGAQTEVRMTR